MKTEQCLRRLTTLPSAQSRDSSKAKVSFCVQDYSTDISPLSVTHTILRRTNEASGPYQARAYSRAVDCRLRCAFHSCQSVAYLCACVCRCSMCSKTWC
jgi:hypothetical protein